MLDWGDCALCASCDEVAYDIRICEGCRERECKGCSETDGYTYNDTIGAWFCETCAEKPKGD